MRASEGTSAPRLRREAFPAAGETFLHAFLDWLRERENLEFADYAELQQWSVDHLEDFWGAVWRFFGVRDHGEVTRVLADPAMPGARWFEGALINYAENALLGVERPAPGGPVPVTAEEPAIIGISETRGRVDLSRVELLARVATVRSWLQDLGVGSGDRVVGYLPNIPDAAVAFLATASLGAVWAGCAPEFGARAVLDRFAQIEPKILIAIGGYTYGGKPIDRSAEVEEIRAGLPSLTAVASVSYGTFGHLHGAVPWPEGPDEPEAVPEFEPVEFGHPLCVLFSSGTSGRPKALVHTHGGFLAEHLKNGALSWDLQAGDRMVWATTTAWMVWNSLVSALMMRASIIMVDGNHNFPDLEHQWRLAEELRPTLMGISPGFIMANHAAGVMPGEKYDLRSIRTLGASGSPLPIAGNLWVDRNFGRDVVFNIGSGGTDVCTAFVQSGPWQGEWIGEMSGKCLGVDVAAYDDGGTPVLDTYGELVVRRPMPSMPSGLWGDLDGAQFHQTYFSRYPGVWWHGDRIRFLSDTGSCAISGRSDATLNRGGVRMGTAEFYNVLEERADVTDSLIVHLEDSAGGNGTLTLFVATADGTLDEERTQSIRDALRTRLSPRHVPDEIRLVSKIPTNKTGKKLEIPVKKILQGAAVHEAVSVETLRDPASLDPFIELAKSRR